MWLYWQVANLKSFYSCSSKLKIQSRKVQVDVKPWFTFFPTILQLIDGNPELYYPTNMCPPTNGRQSANIQLMIL